MTKEEFTSILTEYDYPEEFISALWEERPLDREITEENVRAVADTLTAAFAEALQSMQIRVLVFDSDNPPIIVSKN